MDLSKLTHRRQGHRRRSGIVLFISYFLPWFEASVDSGDSSAQRLLTRLPLGSTARCCTRASVWYARRSSSPAGSSTSKLPGLADPVGPGPARRRRARGGARHHQAHHRRRTTPPAPPRLGIDVDISRSFGLFLAALAGHRPGRRRVPQGARKATTAADDQRRRPAAPRSDLTHGPARGWAHPDARPAPHAPSLATRQPSGGSTQPPRPPPGPRAASAGRAQRTRCPGRRS